MGSKSSKEQGYITASDIKGLDGENKQIAKFFMEHKIKVDPEASEGSRVVFAESTGDSKNFNAIQSLFINGDDKSLSKVASGLKKVLPHVQKKVTITSFKLDNDLLKMLIENSSHVDTLAICFSEVGKLSRKKLKFDTSKKYSIKTLDLFGSCHRSWSDHLTEKKLDKLVSTLSQTNLRDSLQTVHTREDWFTAEHLQPIFDKYEFNVTVVGNNKIPEAC
jgi:predicted nucleotidyltransferase